MKYDLDLHIHSVLSPCADLLMGITNIFNKLTENNIKIFSITDHNSSGNSRVFMKIAEKKGFVFIPGIEIQTSEEIHILGYFSSIEDLEKVSSIIYPKVNRFKNDEDIYGYQLFLDENDEYIDREEALLAGDAEYGLEEIMEIIKKNNGIAVPAHLDRSNSVLSNFGYIPDLDFDAYEVYIPEKIDSIVKKYLLNRPILSSSDAHHPNSIKQSKMYIELENLTTQSVINAIKEGKIFIKKGD